MARHSRRVRAKLRVLQDNQLRMSEDLSAPILMTGATGFLGHYVLRDLLNQNQSVIAVLRPDLAETSERLRTIMSQVGLDIAPAIESGLLRLVEGSIPESLPEPAWGRTASVLNCAASLQLFSNDNGDPFRTNVEGTKAIIDWAERHGVRDIHAVSTAYTCGWNSGTIREEFHHPMPEFQTDYERSKWTAESLLQEWSAQPGHTLTVYRPSFLIGDSNTGYTTQFAGFYQFARLVSVLKTQFHQPNNGTRTYIPLRIPGRPHDKQNIVPVDFVGRLIAEVVVRPQFHGRIYHLTNPVPPTNDMMKRVYEDYFGLHGGYFAEPSEVLGKCSSAESLLWNQYDLLTPRVVHTPIFDVTNTREIMAQASIAFPELNSDRIFMMFDYAASQNWGRRTNGFHS
jgi:nucleoside-diphosphate-sugar epimerase